LHIVSTGEAGKQESYKSTVVAQNAPRYFAVFGAETFTQPAVIRPVFGIFSYSELVLIRLDVSVHGYTSLFSAILYHQSAASPNIICAKLEQKYEKQEKSLRHAGFYYVVTHISHYDS
jgi:hypothetical protein